MPKPKSDLEFDGAKKEDSGGAGGVKFTLKRLIRKLHIVEPVDSVMCLVGKRSVDYLFVVNLLKIGKKVRDMGPYFVSHFFCFSTSGKAWAADDTRGVGQWLERRSLAGGFSLICACMCVAHQCASIER